MATKKREVVYLKIDRCGECPHREVGPSYSMDGFDRGNDWHCKKADRRIVGFVEWQRDEPARVPDWCPLRKEQPRGR